MMHLPGYTTHQDVPAQQLQQHPGGVQLMQVPTMPLHSQQFLAQQSPQMQQVLATQLGASGPTGSGLLPGQMVVASSAQAQQGLLHCSPQQQQQQPVSVGVLTNMLQGAALQL